MSWLLLLPRRTLAAAIRGYQIAVSPLLPPSCRFMPSCSQYALEAVSRSARSVVAGWLPAVWPVAIHSTPVASILSLNVVN